MGDRVSTRDEFSEYVAARRPLLYRTAFVLCGDAHRAEDLVQTVLTKLYLHWPRVSRADSVDGYVRAMLVNADIDAKRRPWRRERFGLEGFDRSAASTDPDEALDLRAALQGLAAGQRQVVVLRYLWALSVDETAAELGIAPGTVKSQTSDALRRLREVLAVSTPEGQS
jgi:RNA polymerase sigma-70 factor (sigma-E family)